MTAHNAPSNEDRTGDDPCYAGFSACGCIGAVTVIRPEYAKDTAKTVAGWIREGLSLKQITVAEARELMAARRPGWGPCEHELAVRKRVNEAQQELAI